MFFWLKRSILNDIKIYIKRNMVFKYKEMIFVIWINDRLLLYNYI